MKITVIGSSNTDMVVKTERFPKPGETIIGEEFFMFPGGKGANQAVAAARLGGNVTLVAKVGNDVFGKQALEGFKTENINTKYVFTDESAASGVALITVNAEGENEIVVASGANGQLNKKDITTAKKAITEAEVIVLQLEVPIETVAYAIKQSLKANKRVILNPAPAQALADELLNGLFLLTPNETEAEILTSIEVTNVATAKLAADELLKKGVQNVIITMGSKGAFFMNETETFLMEAERVKAVDSTAAGDVFNGALAVAIAKNKPWKEAIAFANKAASISVTRMGAQASAPKSEEL
ncbi:MAG: ribokinase [Spirosomataceae bacterium]|jgi:ribokinase